MPPLTILFAPESAHGPTNTCIGIGEVLHGRGHRVVFAAEDSWRGRLSSLGFEEDLREPAPVAPEPADGARFWDAFARETAGQLRRPTIEQLATWVRPGWEDLIAAARHAEPELRQIIARTGPDVIVNGGAVASPALVTAGVPVVRVLARNPLELGGPQLPPAFSGYPADDRTGWDAFRAEYERTHRQLWAGFSAWVVEQGAPPLADLQFVHDGDVNLHVYPEELDHAQRPRWHRLDSGVRRAGGDPELPVMLTDRPPGSALVHFSLGTLGSTDVRLVQRLLAALARTPHRYLVSKGPLHEEIVLAPNMWGAPFLPQVRLLPAVDLVITHGGSASVTEAMHCGVPMIVLPLFRDQHDNAQRVQENGFGLRLDPYRCTESQLRAAVRTVLADESLRARSAAAGARIRARDGVTQAADLIEQAARPD